MSAPIDFARARWMLAWILEGVLLGCGRIGYGELPSKDFNSLEGGLGVGGVAAVADSSVDRVGSGGSAGAEASAFFDVSQTDASDASLVGRCDSAAPIRLYYRAGQFAPSTSHIDYLLKIENATGTALPLSSLKARYYFTNEIPAGRSAIIIYYTGVCCSSMMTNFPTHVLPSLQTLPASPKADAYLEIAFDQTLGLLAAGDAVQVELGFYDSAGTLNSVQTNDYSFNAGAAGTQAEWDVCPGPQCAAKFTSCALTAYRDDVLVWGTPP